MRLSRLGASSAAAVAIARPASAVERVVDAVSSVFGARDAVSFSPVDGVFRAEEDAPGSARRRVASAARVEAHRLYNALGGAEYFFAGPKGIRVDTFA